MTAEGWVIIIGALSTAITSVMTAIVVLLRRDVKETRTDVKEVHTLVNQQHTDEVVYRKVLTDALKVAGVRVPVDKSAELRDTR
jgi:hypothetical protein